MLEYLKKEAEILKLSEYFFQNSNKIYTNWHALIEDDIFEFSRLMDAIMLKPYYLILEIYDDSNNPILVTVYYDINLNPVQYLPFDGWKLYKNISAWGKRKYFLLEDPIGKREQVGLSEHFPSIPGYLRNYTQFNSFQEFHNQPNKPTILGWLDKK